MQKLAQKPSYMHGLDLNYNWQGSGMFHIDDRTLVSKSHIAPLQIRTEAQTLRGNQSEILSDIKPRYPGQSLLGICGSGEYLMMDISDPSHGAVLVAGDSGCGKTKLLQEVVLSAIRLSLPGYLTSEIITSYPQEWDVRESSSSIEYRITGWEQDSVRKLLLRLSDIVEQRLESVHTERVILFVIDDLSRVLDFDRELQDLVLWLLHYGPRAGIFAIATLNTDKVHHFEEWLDLFGNIIIGKTGPIWKLEGLSGCTCFDLKQLVAGEQFCLTLGGKCQRFWLPVLDG